jgi:hypothetical protein
VDTDADDVTGFDLIEIERFQGFVGNARQAMRGRRCRRENKEPAGRDHADSEREMARIYEVDVHRTPWPAAVVVGSTKKWADTGLAIVTLLSGSSLAA